MTNKPLPSTHTGYPPKGWPEAPARPAISRGQITANMAGHRRRETRATLMACAAAMIGFGCLVVGAYWVARWVWG